MRRNARKGTLGRWLLFLLGGGALAVVVAYFAASAWIQNYLRSDALRQMLEAKIGDAAKADCTLEPVSWSGWNAYSPGISLHPRGVANWVEIESEGLQASLDWNAVRRGLWRVPRIDLESLRVKTGEPSPQSPMPAVTARALPDVEAAAGAAEVPGWIARWLPTRTEIGEIEVRRFDLKPSLAGAGPVIDDMRIIAKPAVDEGAWRVRGEEGRLMIPGIAEPFRVGSASMRLDANAFVLDDANGFWRGGSEVTSRGKISFEVNQGWSFSGRLMALDLRHVLFEGWKPKLGGVLEGDYEISGAPGLAALSKGKLRVKNGVVQALPLQERIADFTRTERFRRIVLDEATGDVEAQGPRMRVSNLVLQSNGLIRLEGELAIDGKALLGNFRVGVSPESLRWLPGAQNHVFTDANGGKVPGFVWTTVQVTGTMDAPKENLSNRLLAAMGQAVLIDAPMELLGAGMDVIGKAGAVVPAGNAVIEGGTEVIKGASDAAGKGIEILNNLVPLLPK